MITRSTVLAIVLLSWLGGARAGEGPSGFPLPKDATGGAAAPGGNGKVVVYQVGHGKDVVLAELRDRLKAAGWTVESEERSPRGAVRLVVKKGATSIRASLTGDTERAALILTLP